MDFLAERLERPLERHLVDPHRVDAAHIDRIEIKLVRDGVDQPLAHERGLEAARRAVGRGRRLVGEPEVADRAIGARHAVRPRQHAAGHHRDARRVGAHIGAVVVMDHVVDREDFALLGAGGARPCDAGCANGWRRSDARGGPRSISPGGRAASRRRRPARPRDKSRRGCRSRRRRATRSTDTDDGGRPSMRAISSLFRCGTLAAPCSSSTSREAS